MTTPDPIAAVAGRLTEAQRLMLLENCACGGANQMVELGLWKPDPHAGRPYYVSTPLGLAVCAHLKGQTDAQG